MSMTKCDLKIKHTHVLDILIHMLEMTKLLIRANPYRDLKLIEHFIISIYIFTYRHMYVFGENS